MKKPLLTLLKMLVVGAILIYLIWSGRLNFEKLLLFRDAPEILTIMVGVFILAVVPIATFRWWLLLRAIGVPVEPKQTFVLTWIGNFFNTTLPGAVTGDVVKGYYVIKTQQEEGRTRAFMTLLIDDVIAFNHVSSYSSWECSVEKIADPCQYKCLFRFNRYSNRSQ
jgi:hypothetical protein